MKPNIVFVTVDCWRGDHIGIASDAKAATPNLDALAKESHYFSDAYSCGGWTKVAMTSLFSSTFSSMFGFTKGKMSDQRPLLAEQLANSGYTTAGFSTNMVCGSKGGFDRGFQHFSDMKPSLAPKNLLPKRLTGRKRLNTNPLWHKVVGKLGVNTAPAYPSMAADELVDAGLDWLDQPQSKPYLLWLHFMDLHWPYRSSSRPVDSNESCEMWRDRYEWLRVKNSQGLYDPGDSRAERWRQLYAEETQTLDRSLGRLFERLRDREDWDSTAVCVTSDHAEEFYEHGSWAHSWNQLHAEGTHVPLIIKTPGQKTAVQHDQAASHLDVTPTILEIAKVTADEKMMGKSLFQETQTEKQSAPLYSEMHGHFKSHRYRLAIIFNGYRYIYDAELGQCCMYHLDVDPDCNQDIYSKDSDMGRTFDKLRLKHITQGAIDVFKGMQVIGEDEALYDLDDDPAVVERLRALGYMD